MCARELEKDWGRGPEKVLRNIKNKRDTAVGAQEIKIEDRERRLTFAGQGWPLGPAGINFMGVAGVFNDTYHI